VDRAAPNFDCLNCNALAAVVHLARHHLSPLLAEPATNECRQLALCQAHVVRDADNKIWRSTILRTWLDEKPLVRAVVDFDYMMKLLMNQLQSHVAKKDWFGEMGSIWGTLVFSAGGGRRCTLHMSNASYTKVKWLSSIACMEAGLGHLADSFPDVKELAFFLDRGPHMLNHKFLLHLAGICRAHGMLVRFVMVGEVGSARTLQTWKWASCRRCFGVWRSHRSFPLLQQRPSSSAFARFQASLLITLQLPSSSTICTQRSRLARFPALATGASLSTSMAQTTHLSPSLSSRLHRPFM
jgi:hypothetical protein